MLSDVGQMAMSEDIRIITQCSDAIFETDQGLFISVDVYNDTSNINSKLHEFTRMETIKVKTLIQYNAIELDDVMFQLH